jgi:hypothetical protein
MNTYKETIKKLFEAIDPEGQLQQVQKEMEDSIESAVQAQVADKEEQVKALESEIEQLKAQQAEAPVEEPAVEEVVQAEEQQKQQEQVAQLVQELEAQAEEACQKIEQQEQEIAQLKKDLEEKSEKLQTLQQAVVQDFDAQIKAAKLCQQQEDEELAIQTTQKLVADLEEKHAAEQEQLAESISDFIDAFIDDKTQLNVAINASALAEAQSETFNKIRDLLIEEKLFESNVKAKAEAMILEAKESVNEQLNEAIAINKKNIALENELAALKGANYLAEKVKFLKPSIAEALTEALQGKSVEAIDKEFDKLQAQLEKNEEERKTIMRQQAKLRQQKIDRELKAAEDEKHIEKVEQSVETPSVQSAFAKLISVKRI